MAKRKVGGAARGPKKPGGYGRYIVLGLVGFVVLAIGVTMRRVYGYNQQKRIEAMGRQREALVSEQLKLQDAIRVASDRRHIIDIAQSRLDMRLPDPSQVINLPRRPLGRGRDSIRP